MLRRQGQRWSRTQLRCGSGCERLEGVKAIGATRCAGCGWVTGVQ